MRSWHKCSDLLFTVLDNHAYCSMKILLVDECYPLNTRNVKILSSLGRLYPDSEIHVITWDRAGDFDTNRVVDKRWNWHLYTRSATYGNKLQKLFGLFGYRSFCKKEIRIIKPDVIIASHWNNLLMLPRLDYEKQMLIYENLDAPTGPFFIRYILRCIECSYMSNALTIHASRFYTAIYPKKYRQLVLENKPVFNTAPIDYSPQSPLRIAYLGNIRYIDILKNLADAVKGDGRFCLSYHGGGPDYENLSEYVAGISNISLTGPYKYEDIEQLYRNADVIWAAYPNRDFNVQYAISNKFHESLAYAIPSIYADKTRLGEYVVAHSLGCQVNPYSVEDIRSLLITLSSNKGQLLQIHKSLRTQIKEETSWDDDFSALKTEIDAFFSC